MQVAWALVMPPFTAPDEPEHVSYVQSLAENGERPPTDGPRRHSAEMRLAHRVAGGAPLLPDRSHNPAWEPAIDDFWELLDRDLRRDDGGNVGPQANQPPLYYAYETAPYAAASGGDAFDRLFAMRLWSGLLMLVTVAGAWLLIGELTRRDRLLQLAGASCVGLQPMMTSLSAGVNPDAMLFAAYAIALWLMARLLVRPPTRAALIGLLAAAAAAALAKPAGLALVPAVALVVLVLARRRGGRHRARLAAAGASAAGAAVLVAGVLAAPGLVEDRTPVNLELANLRGFATYLWDFYLPRLPFQHEYAALSVDNPVWTVWVKYTWAAFGRLEVQFPGFAYAPLALVSVAVPVAAAVAVRRGRLQVGRALLAAAALTAGSLVLGLHWADFQGVSETPSHRLIQGRYLLPLMPLVGVAVAAALTNLGGRRRVLAAGLVVGGMAVLQLASLAAVTGFYFA